jgi:flavodoxin
MKKAVIVYQSKTGTTKKYSEEIGDFFSSNGFETTISSISDFDNISLINADFVFLGCWTKGMFLFFQHPDKEWISFAKKLSLNNGVKVGLFATYKVATGSMFNKMKKHLNDKVDLVLKSKNGLLSDADKSEINYFINN